jgi:hypothetical protein
MGEHRIGVSKNVEDPPVPPGTRDHEPSGAPTGLKTYRLKALEESAEPLLFSSGLLCCVVPNSSELRCFRNGGVLREIETMKGRAWVPQSANLLERCCEECAIRWKVRVTVIETATVDPYELRGFTGA